MCRAWKCTVSSSSAYASFINGHLQDIAGGAIYADLGAVESAAEADIQTAIDAGQSQTQIDELQATASGITSRRDPQFIGETMRDLLLSAYAWSIAGMCDVRRSAGRGARGDGGSLASVGREMRAR